MHAMYCSGADTFAFKAVKWSMQQRSAMEELEWPGIRYVQCYRTAAQLRIQVKLGVRLVRGHRLRRLCLGLFTETYTTKNVHFAIKTAH